MLDEMPKRFTSFAMLAFTLWMAFPGLRPFGQTLRRFRRTQRQRVPGAVQNSVALIDLAFLLGQQAKSLAMRLVAGVDQPPVSLKEDGRA